MMGPVSDALVHEVHGHSGHLDPVAQGVLDGGGAGKRRQQGRMQVDDRATGSACTKAGGTTRM